VLREGVAEEESLQTRLAAAHSPEPTQEADMLARETAGEIQAGSLFKRLDGSEGNWNSKRDCWAQ
jgi:hypothetical protein